MKIVGMIPARLNSSRFPGKVLALLGDRPLFWHVYDAAVRSGVFDAVYVAADDKALQAGCQDYDIPCLMTGTGHLNPTSRIQEAAGQVEADYYVMMGADEPLISPDAIRQVVLTAVSAMSEPSAPPFVVNAVTPVHSAPEVLDASNIKIVCSQNGLGLYASRSPIPYPKGSLDYHCKKFVSIGVYTKEALDFFAASPGSELERIEEFDLLRFMEHRKPVLFTEIPGPSLSVDTPKDLEAVRNLYFNRTHPYRGVIFDLDGTLLDTAEGVMESVRYTAGVMGYEPPDEKVLRTFIGPPVKHSFIRHYHLSEAEADRATEVFRNRYKNHDLLKAAPYEGLMALLADLKREGYQIGVATLKREDYALTLLEHYHISDYCDCICGSDFASRMQKTDVLHKCLAGLHLSPDEAVLIGDTSSDGSGARETGTALIGVTYGFGPSSPEEWKEFEPVFIAGKPADIGVFLGLYPET